MAVVGPALCSDCEINDISPLPSPICFEEHAHISSVYSSIDSCLEEPTNKTTKPKRQDQRLPEDLEIFEFPVSSFPRYESALDNIGDIAIRYSNCFQTDRSTEEIETKVRICKKSGDASVRIDEIVHTTEAMSITPTLIGRTKNLTQSDVKMISSSILITRKKQKNLIRWADKNCFAVVIVVANKYEKRKAVEECKFQSNKRIIISHHTAAFAEICNFLERSALSKVKTPCEEIYGLINSERSALLGSHEQAFFEEMSSKRLTEKSTFFKQSDLCQSTIPSNTKKLQIESETVFPTEYPCTNKRILKGSVYDVKGLFKPYTLDKENMEQIQLRVKESLLEEMVALYKASNVPNTDWPTIPTLRDKDRKVPKEICERIFRTCSDVRGIGYRFDVLQLTVGDNTSKESEDTIRKLLKEMRIDAYEIAFMSIKEFSSVGAEIYVDTHFYSGSLGCFATMTSIGDARQCLLLSKHVAVTGKGKEGEDGKVYAKENNRFLGHILQDTMTEQGYDIAATLLKVGVETCDTGFRNSKGKKIRGVIGGKNFKSNLRGRKVYLWGAKSRPGKGIITVPHFTMDDMKEHYILIEDVIDGEHQISQRFTKPGDSGAVACVDDPGQHFLHPLSMIVGLYNYKDVEEDNKKEPKTVRGQYLTLPLDEGLKELGTRTRSTFKLMLD